MKITLIVIGKTTDAHVQALIDEYSRRLQHYVPFELDVIPELRATRGLSIEQQKAQEAELLQKRLHQGDYIVLLDEHGRERRSVDFAAWLEKREAAGAWCSSSGEPTASRLRFTHWQPRRYRSR